MSWPGVRRTQKRPRASLIAIVDKGGHQLVQPPHFSVKNNGHRNDLRQLIPRHDVPSLYHTHARRCRVHTHRENDAVTPHCLHPSQALHRTHAKRRIQPFIAAVLLTSLTHMDTALRSISATVQPLTLRDLKRAIKPPHQSHHTWTKCEYPYTYHIQGHNRLLCT